MNQMFSNFFNKNSQQSYCVIGEEDSNTSLTSSLIDADTLDDSRLQSFAPPGSLLNCGNTITNGPQVFHNTSGFNCISGAMSIPAYDILSLVRDNTMNIDLLEQKIDGVISPQELSTMADLLNVTIYI